MKSGPPWVALASELSYPHHPQPNEAAITIAAATTIMSHMSSFAMIVSLSLDEVY